jgi:hypothetical protein
MMNQITDLQDCILGFFEHLHPIGMSFEKCNRSNSCCFSQLLRRLTDRRALVGGIKKAHLRLSIVVKVKGAEKK